ncbi:GIY-YIG nuclease family protein [Psychromarinibacter sp. C21-152]|uniref:GIY-YIG nuclease family protein n=1 Tax=Psychromarinibacter sediminicola TaxID=3033385 RepID=A0AAE3NQS1_9RHOB|nr:GIY-YIG nuclease family protein [Psychromarinibacter sediminicola]MDF0600372.1 GIY-YIG nuclease family protein [Psychromarinibacter sediminicola]
MDRRAAKAAWKEATPDAGVYAVRIGERVWVGAAMRLGAAERRLRFTLRMGSARPAALQAAYAGEMTFEVLEAFDPEMRPMTRERMLKERAAHWVARLGAAPA